MDRGLLFYDAAVGQGEFYTTNQGRLTVVRGTTEDLSGNNNLAALRDLDVGTCTMAAPATNKRSSPPIATTSAPTTSSPTSCDR